MSGKSPLKVVLCWHMHQPEYRDGRSGSYQLPWTYLHALKDYVDMAAYLERCPQGRAVVNFAPILLDQLADYGQQLKAHGQGGAIHDPLLAALVEPALPTSEEGRQALMRACLRINQQRVIARFPDFERIAALAQWLLDHPGLCHYQDEQLLADLLVWYHLGWLGETVRDSDQRVQQLQDKGRHYSLADRQQLLAIITEQILGLGPRYRRLAQAGQVELAMSPYAHPIMPLLLSLGSAREAMPGAPLPQAPSYPGGEERVLWQLHKGLECFEAFFGIRPAGCWPSEGALSTDTLRLLAKEGFKWAASGESVLQHSLDKARHDPGFHLPQAQHRHCLYRFDEADIDCFFRDDQLSDLIGFNYADWHADDAVGNLLHHLQAMQQGMEAPEKHLVTIILDGENAWEYYPENARYFLGTLYHRLSAHPDLKLTTFGALQQEAMPRVHLPALVAGSWVYGTLSTWIGSHDKNLGWDLLIQAKQCFDKVVAEGRLDQAALHKAEAQLAVCEGSDWFWWFGDYNPAQTVSDFERLFRSHLAYLYQLLGEPVPGELSRAISHGRGQPVHGGVMLHGQAQDGHG
ncbi:glycoside hydrolase family 57 protein [Gallaecimonas kandeliae]|uniref:glycoside hydrolase family 57 protein n=1 Tax=Gallaecimonas kandeliae TaxID=3029055 RepID=UPI00264980C8|nr:glycoside hydrolase family 57 protein [Gallaecimonas kandeliae]WKE64814.1 glycoside hydrolase family 57 protein [Gallaecimonas kandeliae]